MQRPHHNYEFAYWNSKTIGASRIANAFVTAIENKCASVTVLAKATRGDLGIGVTLLCEFNQCLRTK